MPKLVSLGETESGRSSLIKQIKVPSASSHSSESSRISRRTSLLVCKSMKSYIGLCRLSFWLKTLRNGSIFTSMPEIQEIEEDKEPYEPSYLKSTEDICNEAGECFSFKALHNPGLYQAYYLRSGQKDKIESNEEKYLRLVKEVKIAPVKRIINSLSKSSIELQFYGLDSRQIKPLTEALVSNTSVREIDLTCNPLSLDALYHLSQLIKRNKTIKKLCLQHCKIGPEGAEILGNGLDIRDGLEELDLSHNEIGDEGMGLLGIKLGYNLTLRRLSLRHNGLGQDSAYSLAETMEENMTLHHLDLSWNQLFDEKGFRRFLSTTADLNESLRSLDLSWNGLGGDKMAATVKNFIGQHKNLRELNLSHNKFASVSENSKIGKGVSASESLLVLNLSYNGLTANAAYALLSNINPKAKLRTLTIDNVWVKPEFEKLRRELEMQTGLKVVFEGVSGGFDIKGPDMQTLLLKRANYLGYKPQKNKKDFGWFLLRLQNAGTLVPLKKAKFLNLVQEDKIKFDDGMIDELAKKFRDENKKIDLNLMLEKYLMLFPDTALPIPKEKKKRKASQNSSKSRGGTPRTSRSSRGSGKRGRQNTSREVRDSKTESASSTEAGDIKPEQLEEDGTITEAHQKMPDENDELEKIIVEDVIIISDTELLKEVKDSENVLHEEEQNNNDITDYYNELEKEDVSKIENKDKTEYKETNAENKTNVPEINETEIIDEAEINETEIIDEETISFVHENKINEADAAV